MTKTKSAAAMRSRKPTAYRVVKSYSDPEADLPAPEGWENFVVCNSLGTIISTMGRMMDRALDAGLKQHGVTFGQWPILLFLWAEEGVSQRELGRLVAIEDATITRTIDRMVRDGLVERRPHPTDRRQHAIYLTPRGAGLRDLLIPIAININTSATRRLTPETIKQLIVTLRMIKHDMEGGD
jgi:DNA-binding MarR family transcriptional regulator